MYGYMYVVAFEVTKQRALNKKCKSTNAKRVQNVHKTLCKTRYDKQKKNLHIKKWYTLKKKKKIQVKKVKINK